MKELAILKTGGTFPELATQKGDFEDWILTGLGISRDEALIVDVVNRQPFPRYDRVAGIVITGSHAMVTENHTWSASTADWLVRAFELEIPILGICYGHQLLVQALGGQVGNNPRGKEFGSVSIHATASARDDLLFKSMPDSFGAHVCHTQSVFSLPHGARVLASSGMDAHQAFAAGKYAWGVQFHPEFDFDAITHYITVYADELRQQGDDPAHLLRQCRETPESTALLHHFYELVRAINS